MIMIKHYNPVIVFSFSKRECEALALLMSKMDSTTQDEKDMIRKVFNNAIGQLAEADQDLPQIKSILPLLERGIGIHHSGLLPILKEVIELLFQEGLIKILFATETFSIGLNMPAKTVVFTNVRKWDGKEFRWLSGGEYIQMSGRAGRRGLDDRGIVILMIDEQMEPAVAKGMVKGEADRLDSAFHLSYNMLLNLMRVEGISPEYMLENCFYQFQNSSTVPKLQEEVDLVKNQINDMSIDDEATVAEYYSLRDQLKSYEDDIRHVITHPSHIVNFLQPGRLIHVKVKDADYGWGTVVSFVKRKPLKKSAKSLGAQEYTDHESYLVDALLWVASASPMHLVRKTSPVLPPGIRPPKDSEEPGMMVVLAITLDSIVEVGNLRVFLPKDLNSSAQRNTVKSSLDEINRRFPDGISLLDPVENMHIKDESFLKLMRKVEVIESKLYSNHLHNSPRLKELYEKYSQKMALGARLKDLKGQINKALSITQLEELRCRKRVLRRLGFITIEDIVELKGRVACEISSGDELLLTELIFNGTFTDLEPEECAAILSCFVFQEKSKEEPQLKGKLQTAWEELQTMAKRLAGIYRECNLDVVIADYVDSFKYEVMDVVFKWAKGATFAQICKMTDVYEGSLIRMFRRLEELIMEIMEAAKIIGNTSLQEKMQQSLALIKRDIVSAGSLYL